MKIVTMIVSIIFLLSLSGCGNTNIDNSQDANVSTSDITSSEPKETDTSDKTYSSYPHIENERDPSIKRDLVGDPMEAYFVTEDYKTKSYPEGNNPIYWEDSFIKGTYPLDKEELDYKSARAMVIQFKEDIDMNCFYDEEKPAISIIYGSHKKDITQGYNFSYDCVTQKLLITDKGAGNGFGSGNTIEIIINGDNLRTAEIQDTDIKYEDGRIEHIDGQRSRQLTGTYSFVFYTSLK